MIGAGGSTQWPSQLYLEQVVVGVIVVGAIVVVTCIVDIDSEVVAVVTTVSRQLPNQPY